MKYKKFFALLAIFVIVATAATVFAESASLGSFNFDVPSGYKISNQNDTTVILKNADKQIVVSTELVDESSIRSYLYGQGFKFDKTVKGNNTVTGAGESGSYDFNASTYSKDNGFAIAYLVNKDGQDLSVIAIDNNYKDSGNKNEFIPSTEVGRQASSLLGDIMLK